MTNNIWLSETYENLREENLNNAIREKKVMADIFKKRN